MLTKLSMIIKLHFLNKRLERLLGKCLIPSDFDLEKDIQKNAQLSYLFANQFLTGKRKYSDIKIDKFKTMTVPLSGVAFESFMKIMDALSTTVGKSENSVLLLNDYIVAYGIKEITRILLQDKTLWMMRIKDDPISLLRKDYRRLHGEKNK